MSKINMYSFVCDPSLLKLAPRPTFISHRGLDPGFKNEFRDGGQGEQNIPCWQPANVLLTSQ